MPRWCFELDIKIENRSNASWHRGQRSRYVKAQRKVLDDAIGDRLRLLAASDGDQDWHVHFVRISPGKLDGGDNLALAFKAHRDQVAECLGRDDRDGTGIAWSYSQRKAGKGKYGMEVVLVLDPPRCSHCGQHMPFKDGKGGTT